MGKVAATRMESLRTERSQIANVNDTKEKGFYLCQIFDVVLFVELAEISDTCKRYASSELRLLFLILFTWKNCLWSAKQPLKPASDYC